ncbi:monooxygenase [Sphaerisporangium siamense]|uniref:2-polyprenyl-6-methoxyphenol hydroxylase-like FAD-dependent oxidoreductase n=1 Tax=Sphaerisporangium siamense TaxID=795645 RepID=A0A7W7D4X1_9ACTN|nr:FAD-dependent monooxygenase [Sphaerisporangium siamense]MBB4700039.1 2-polyprenyl-6-methoxyphenol hydroxylase-like FAD-dependent oxidoreductase [Sphaerisporangium siamense]GII84643.1 monooxygenase [Sphaerisporangium siamense]
MNRPAHRKILISGASIAGPSLAYWLDRYGFEVTIVEQAAHLRGGGYAIDIRGTARDVVERMGLLPRLRQLHVDARQITFLNPDGTILTSLRPEAITGGAEGLDLEVRRGDLANCLYGLVENKVEFLFDDSIATLDDRGDQVEVTFDSGTRRTFDLVIGADGLHSNTRGLAFGPEERYHRYLGFCFAGFTLANDLGLQHEGLLWNAPGRAATLYAYDPGEPMHGFLIFARDEPPYTAFRTPQAQRDLVAATFPDTLWEIPRMVDAMRAADDLFFDVVSQIHMPVWSTGRVALVGDAAHATSFLSGQGSSVSLAAAYVLAGELATHDDHVPALAAYENTVRNFAEQNQALATAGGGVVAPRTRQHLDARNAMLRTQTTLPSGTEGRAANTALTLPDYEHALAR